MSESLKTARYLVTVEANYAYADLIHRRTMDADPLCAPRPTETARAEARYTRMAEAKRILDNLNQTR